MRPALPISPTTTALALIECQREWLEPNALLRTRLVKDQADFEATVANGASLLAACRAAGYPIAHAGLDMRHDPDYLLFAGGGNMAGLRGAIPHASTWTGDQVAFVEPFVPRSGEYVVQGRSGASAITNSTLDPFLRNNGISTIILAGHALHVCVESTLRAAHDLGYNVLVATDACGVFEPAQRAYFLEHVVHHFGQAESTAELSARLG